MAVYDFDFDNDKHRQDSFNQLVKQFGSQIVCCPSPNSVQTINDLSTTDLSKMKQVIDSLSIYNRLSTLESKVGISASV